MMVGVVAYDVPLAQHPADKIRILLNVIAHDKERGFDIVLRQCLQNRLGTAVFIACVEGQIDLLLRLITEINRVIAPQRFL